MPFIQGWCHICSPGLISQQLHRNMWYWLAADSKATDVGAFLPMRTTWPLLSFACGNSSQFVSKSLLNHHCPLWIFMFHSVNVFVCLFTYYFYFSFTLSPQIVPLAVQTLKIIKVALTEAWFANTDLTITITVEALIVLTAFIYCRYDIRYLSITHKMNLT